MTKSKGHDTRTQVEEKAVLIGVFLPHEKGQAGTSIRELARLAETAGVEVVDALTQNKDRIDSRWFIGKGKVQEVRERMQELGANVAIFDDELSGAQVRNLEEALDAKIIDRTQLILDIFAGRAKTREGKLQVELAQLSYLLPRLYGQGKNLSRLGGGIGTRGPGESQLETDRRHIRGRINELKRQLSEVVRHRELHREHRRKTGVFQVALVGYTNAGKSTLLRQLTGADAYVENKLFATLDATSRRLELPGGQHVLLTDTVGFIQNLPHDLVAAFRSTLEEVVEADLLLHVVDASDPDMEQQIQVVEQVLADLGAHKKEHILVLNKMDKLPAERRESLPYIKDSLRISAFSEDDMMRLKTSIEERWLGRTASFRLPVGDGKLLALAHRIGDVVRQDTDEDAIHIRVRFQGQAYEMYGSELRPFESDQHGLTAESDMPSFT